MRNSILASLLLLASATSMVAQQPITPRSVGRVGAMSSTVEGFEAGLFNPARLTTKQSSLSILGASTEGYLSPFTLNYPNELGQRLDAREKRQTLEQIRSAGYLQADGYAGIHWFGFSKGAFALNVTSEASVIGRVSPSVAEAILYGGVGEGGDRTEMTAGGSDAYGWAASMVSISTARVMPVNVPGQLSGGITLKAGHVHARGAAYDRGGSMQQDPFGASASADAIHALGGVMYGADLGLAWEHKRWNAALVARNIASQHVKSDQDISVRRISVASSLEGARVTDERLTMDDLNEEDQDRVRGFWTRPLQKATLSIAAAYRFKTLTPEFEIRLGDDPEGKAERTLALGATWKPVEWAGIHAGTAAGEETHALSAGVSIAAGPIALDVAASQRLGVKNGIGMAAQLSVRP